MTTTETHGPEQASGHDDHHPGPRDYVRIAIILAILTALEVSTYFVDFGALGIPLLIVLMIVKFIMVAGFFMHLRFDTKLYSRFLYGGLLLAVSLYTATLVVMFFDQAPTV
ncbi:cytochrome C oxidase subunit IV family protein [Egicoccus halophilus]|uniref:Cytochrome C oxidase subunit IV n=1 Tax=Egicoccus halophilus TaxID=1670830 RepID=A0A8J3AGC1_9ACTN|nr:cytochrome C oxidase subunit IV family protein [Egicoccus halophilus]GGI07658.1 hypothetical protein GCM10011354_25190 [Egicoccus halophilus]